MGSGKTPAPPGFTPQESAFQASGANLVNLQRDLLMQQQMQARALEEITLRQSGLERFSTGTPADPHAAARVDAREKLKLVERGLNPWNLRPSHPSDLRDFRNSLEAVLNLPRPQETFGFRETEERKQQRERERQREEKRFAVEELSLENQRNALLSLRSQEPAREEVSRLALERQQKALRGELPIDQGLLKDLGKREQTLRDTLRANIGTGFETSTAGIQALQEFEQGRQATLDAARRGDIGNIQSLTGGIQGDIQGLTPLTFGGGPNISFRPPETFLGLQTPFAGMFGQAAGGYSGLQEPYQRQRELLYQSQLANAQKSNLFGDIFGGIIGTGLGFATGGLGTAFGTAIGTGLGQKIFKP